MTRGEGRKSEVFGQWYEYTWRLGLEDEFQLEAYNRKRDQEESVRLQ